MLLIVLALLVLRLVCCSCVWGAVGVWFSVVLVVGLLVACLFVWLWVYVCCWC